MAASQGSLASFVACALCVGCGGTDTAPVDEGAWYGTKTNASAGDIENFSGLVFEDGTMVLEARDEFQSGRHPLDRLRLSGPASPRTVEWADRGDRDGRASGTRAAFVDFRFPDNAQYSERAVFINGDHPQRVVFLATGMVLVARGL